MGTDFFNTDVIPQWRQAGTIRLAATAQVAVGDPCHGLDPVTGDLAPGTWVWEIRDADETGEPAHSVWEVRLRHADQPAAADLDWLDDYGYYRDEVNGHTLDAFRGVDAGVIYWRIDEHRPATDADVYYDDSSEALLADHSFEPAHATREGRLLGTSSGWGDGSYPVVVRRDENGQLVDIRTCYVTPSPGPLDHSEFTRLFNGAFREGEPLAGPYALHLTRRSYTVPSDDDPTTLAENTYDRLVSVSGTAPDGSALTFTSSWNDPEGVGEVVYDGHTVDRINGLWSRVEHIRTDLVAAEIVHAVKEHEPRGRVVSSTDADIEVRLTL